MSNIQYAVSFRTGVRIGIFREDEFKQRYDQLHDIEKLYIKVDVYKQNILNTTRTIKTINIIRTIRRLPNLPF